jgi:hypothetical protein
MAGRTYTNPVTPLTHYRCPHNWANPKHAADHPGHPHTVQISETRLDDFTGIFFATRIFGPERAALLAAQLPATDAAAAADRDARQTAIKTRIARIEAAQDAKIVELEDLPANPDDPATQAYRARIRARFAQLHDEREQLEAQLKALAKTVPHAADTSLLFDIAIYWNKTDRQVTVHAEITEATLRAVQDILNPTRDGFTDTCPEQTEPVGHSTNTPRAIRTSHPLVSGGAPPGPGVRTGGRRGH